MATHIHSDAGKPFKTRADALRREQIVRANNSSVGAKGWTTEVVESDNGYIVVEKSPGTAKKK